MAVSRVPTIHDVARAAGVSISTVSRALSRPERVNPDTREVVVRAAARLGYQPSPQAQSLLSGRSSTVMLVLPDVTNPVYFGLVRGVQREAAAAGYRQIVVDTDESALTEAAQLAAAQKSVDGVVVAASRLPDAELAAAAERVPLVTLNRSVPGVGTVVIDTAAALRTAVADLAELGHTELAYLAGPAISWSDARRWRAVADTARRLGIRAVRLGRAAPTRDAGREATGLVLDARVTAVVTFNDLQAIGLLGGLADRGVDVPGRISVVGCDDVFGADFVSPSLTTVAAPVEHAGRLATAMLLARLADGDAPVRAERVPATLVVRASTGPAPTTGPVPPTGPVPTTGPVPPTGPAPPTGGGR